MTTLRRFLYAVFMIALVCLGVVVAGDVQAIVSGDEAKVTYLVNWRPLEGEESSFWVSTINSIDSITGDESMAELVEITVSIADAISNSPPSVKQPTKRSLRRKLGSHLYETIELREGLVLQLLDSADATVQLVALDALKPYATDQEFDTLPTISQRLIELLRDQEVGSEVRRSIMGAFFIDGSFDMVRPIAGQLSIGSNPELARTAAYYMCRVLPGQEFRTEYVTKQFRKGSPILSQEAALALLDFEYGHLEPRARTEVRNQVLSMITDSDLPPVVRGNAIDAAHHLLDDERVLQSIMALLERDKWFFGVKDNHGPGHSLVIVLETLARAENPEVTQRLTRFRSELQYLSDGDRPSVESALNRALDNVD